MSLDENASALGRLLEELSWVGKTISNYRNGGRGYENVLTAEVLQALDFLPRQAFLGSVVGASHGAPETRDALRNEIEDAETKLLPGNFYLISGAERHTDGLPVQPDGLITTPSCYVLLEAKRIRSSSFQAEQLAREYVLLMRDVGGRAPLLWLLLGSEPPVKVQGHGKLKLEKAIALHIDSVLDRTEDFDLSKHELIAAIPAVVSWITWHEVHKVVSEQIQSFDNAVPSVQAAIERLAGAVIRAIEWHS